MLWHLWSLSKAIHKHQWALALISLNTIHHTCGCFKHSVAWHTMCFFHFADGERNSGDSAQAFYPCFLPSMLTNNSTLFTPCIPDPCHHGSFSNILSLQHITGTLQFALQINVLFAIFSEMRKNDIFGVLIT